VEIDNTAYNAGIVFADTYQSELGNALCLENEDIDFSVMVDMGRQKIGFRAVKDEINLAEIVGHLGGGGHPKASGCKLTAERLLFSSRITCLKTKKKVNKAYKEEMICRLTI
jgi:oligoribonuclease NrnB/cAMP/cGMP phosphodiesterase (DHH superfamily)